MKALFNLLGVLMKKSFLAAVTTLFSKLINWLRLRHKREHLKRISAARDVLAVLNQIREDERDGKEPRAIAYLRKIHSAAFEELALTLFEESGFFVLRNKAYTGDGGIDGRVWIPKLGFVPVQSKRYARYIQLQHVIEFGYVIRSQNKSFGFFIHTGKTGEGSRDQSRMGCVVLLSGFEFVRCAMGEQSMHELVSKKVKL